MRKTVKIPLKIISNYNLPPGAIVLYIYLKSLSYENGYLSKSQKVISKETNYSPRNLSRLFRELETNNIISYDKTNTKKGNYRKIFLNGVEMWKT